MYTPKDFRVTDPDVAFALIRHAPFGMLISVVDGEPAISHLPFSIIRTEPTLHLAMHLAKANPHAQQLDGARVRIAFSGVHGYISPRWYSNPSHDVPTWDYAVVHCSGTAQIASNHEKLAILTQLVTEMESAAEHPWSMQMLDREYRDEHMQHIVAFTIHVESIEAKFKLSQNRTRADRDRVVAGLRESGPYQNNALADAIAEKNPVTTHLDG